MNTAPSIADALTVCHRITKAVAVMTYDDFRNALQKVGIDPGKDTLKSYQQFRSNPAKWLTEANPQTQSVELIEWIMEATES